jgi:cell division protein FtsZ
MAEDLELTQEAPAEELSLDDYAGDDDSGDELLLGGGAAVEPEETASFIDDVAEEPKTSSGTRPWLQEPVPAARAAREGGTLFERMSNIARGAAKAQVDEEEAGRTERDPLDIPRFLNRQNNQ